MFAPEPAAANGLFPVSLMTWFPAVPAGVEYSTGSASSAAFFAAAVSPRSVAAVFVGQGGDGFYVHRPKG